MSTSTVAAKTHNPFGIRKKGIQSPECSFQGWGKENRAIVILQPVKQNREGVEIRVLVQKPGRKKKCLTEKLLLNEVYSLNCGQRAQRSRTVLGW